MCKSQPRILNHFRCRSLTRSSQLETICGAIGSVLMAIVNGIAAVFRGTTTILMHICRHKLTHRQPLLVVVLQSLMPSSHASPAAKEEDAGERGVRSDPHERVGREKGIICIPEENSLIRMRSGERERAAAWDTKVTRPVILGGVCRGKKID